MDVQEALGRLSREELERVYVHDVYEAIASHFSSTRYKPWPRIQEFLVSLPTGSMVADVGCGNGKYLGVRRCEGGIWCCGSDRSAQLARICADRGFDCTVCDNLRLPYRDRCFDAVISVAVIHHFSSVERRALAVKELFRIVRPGGQVLIYVWALEQEKKRFVEKDNFVPWHLSGSFKQPAGTTRTPNAAAKKQEEEKKEEEEVKEEEGEKQQESGVYQRYYHVFAKGELEDLVASTDLADIAESGYDHENWFVLARRR